MAGSTDAGSELVLGDEGPRVRAEAPDRRSASRVVAALDRAVWQRLDVSDEVLGGVVVGVRHRRPVELRVGPATAVGLVEAGIPTLSRYVGPGR